MKSSHILFIVALLVVTGCGRGPDKQAIEQGFAAHRVSLTALRTMIVQDTETGCFEVGRDHIGDYWEHGGEWTASNDYGVKLQLAQVLEKVHLSNERYTEYLRLLQTCGASRVSYCKGHHGWTRIIVFSSGIAVSGTLISLNVNDDGFVPKTDIQAGYSNAITPLADGWYIEGSST